MQFSKENLPQSYDELRNLTLKLMQECESLKADLQMAQNRTFGRKTDYIDPRAVQLFNEVEEVHSELAHSAIPETESPVEEKPKKSRGKRRPIPEHLPRTVHVHDIPEDQKICSNLGCDCKMKQIGEEVSETLDYIPAKITVIRHVRPKYACPSCSSEVKTAPVAEQPIPKSLASPALLAYILVSKYADALPLYRLETIFRRLGLDISRTSMARWVIQVSSLIDPIVSEIKRKIMTGPVVNCDETGIQVLKQQGKAVGSDCCMWVLARDGTDCPGVLFQFDRSRSKSVPNALFSGYSGFLQADGFSGYDEVGRRSGISRIGCWAHARRKFTDSLKVAGDKKEGTIAFEAATMIKALYEIEREIAALSRDERFRIRQEKSKPILKEMRSWLNENLSTIMLSSPTGKALTYMNNEWEYLERYVDDGALSIDNNVAERAIRPFAIGRKNWMFSDTPAGASASAKIYSLIETAKANGVEPFEYLKFVLSEISSASKTKQFERLYPWNFANRHLH